MSRVGSFLKKNVRAAVDKFTDGASLADGLPSLRGHVDRVELSPSFARASGWTQLPEGFTGPAPCLVLGGRVVGHVTHQFPRPDLLAAGLGPRALGFNARLLRPLSTTEAVRVRLALTAGRSVVEQAPPEVVALPPGLGAIDRVEAGNVVGWVYVDPAVGGEPALWIDDHRVGAIACEVERPDVHATGLPTSLVGFSKDLLDTEDGAQRDAIVGCFDGAEHHLSIRLDRREIVGVDVLLTLEYDGRLDSSAHGRLRGWAVTRTLPRRRVKLDILCDGDPFLSVTADQARPDIARAKLSDGRSGFDVHLPVSPSGASPVVLSLQTSDTRQPLRAKSSEPVALPRFFPGRSVLSAVERAESAGCQVTIVIPIYNAAREVAACIASVEQHTRAPYRLLLIDDASTDPEVSAILARYETRPHVAVVRHATNQGFTRNINLGFEWAGRDDVVMLNSDTEVTPRWLTNLRLAAYSGERVGTATALSNAAGAFSVPHAGQVNELPAWLPLDAYARAVTQASAVLWPRAPTGNGFCMYVRRDLLDAVGSLDEQAFPRGYGEENDLCMRAVRHGFEHVVDDRTFIYHVRSASFGEQKHELMSAGRAIVDDRYPEYATLVSEFAQDPELAIVRHRVRRVLARGVAPRPRVLFVTSTQTGGTPQTNQDLMSALEDRYEALLLRCDAQQLFLYSVEGSTLTQVEHATLARPIGLASHASSEYDEVVARWLVHHAIELVHVRHIAWHSVTLTSLVKRLGLGLVFSLHDFYTVCPSVKLLDQDLRYCGGQCTPGIGERDCAVELWPARSAPPLKHRWVHAWRAKMARMLAEADCLVTTSEGARDTLRDNFPALADKPFHVIEHGRDFPRFEQLAGGLEEGSRIRVLLPGNVNEAKGAALVAELARLDSSELFEFHLLGDVGRPLERARVVRHGRYARHEFAARVAAIRPHFGAIFSIWPETYCHTLTELWAAGVPVVALDLGAVGERIREHGGGWLLPVGSAEDVYRELVRLTRDVEGHLERLSEVSRWQRGHGRVHDTRAMARRYAAIYGGLLGRGRSSDVPCVAVVTPSGTATSAPASEHVRVRERTLPSAGRPIDYERVHWSAVITSGAARFDAVLVQRTAVPKEHVAAFVESTERAGMPILFELDDDLLDVPAEKDPDGHYAAQAPGLAALARAAALVTVSTPPLAEQLRVYNPNVVVVPNALSERLWLTPDANGHPEDRAESRRADEFRLFYMGQLTHAEDLQLVEHALELVRVEFPATELFVVGGSRERLEWCEHLSVPDHAKDYPSFVPWVRGIARTMDVAIAPLTSSPFNRSKSPLKYLDYAALGLPAVFSDVAPYTDAVRAGETGLLVPNTPEAWALALTSLLRDRTLRARLAQAARAEVMAHHRLGPTLAAWDTQVMSVLSHAAPKRA